MFDRLPGRLSYYAAKIQIMAVLMLCLVATACVQKNTSLVVETNTPQPVFPLVVSSTTSSTTSTSTSTPTPTQTPTQTFAVILFSPDGTMKLQSSDWKNYEILDKKGKVLWTFSYDPYKLDPEADPPLWDGFYLPFYWSQNGNDLYIASLHGHHNSSTKFYGNAYVDGNGLVKFDIENGLMTDVLSELRLGYYGFAFSPDEKTLIYANQTETPVKIRSLDLDTQVVTVLWVADENILEAGSFGWSPERDKLLFITLENNSESTDSSSYSDSIYLYNFETANVQRIVEHLNRSFSFVSWNDRGQVFLRDTDDSIWQMNLNTRDFSLLATKTPWPLLSTPTP